MENKTTSHLSVGNTFGDQIDQLIQTEPNLQGAVVGISVRCAETGCKLYEHMGNIRLRPASNMKLFTGVAALKVLGKNYTFSTELLTAGDINGNVLTSHLYLKGKGDPTLLEDDFNNFAKELRKMGITYIDGDIIGDDTWYDTVRLSQDLIWSDEHYYYGAQVSALTASPNKDYDAGTVIINVKPAQSIGENPLITVTPKTDYVRINNQAETVASGEEADITIERNHGGNTITITGKIPIDSQDEQEWIAVWEPSLYALDLFQQSLRNYDISWSGNITLGKTPNAATLLLSRDSIPLSELIIPFMKLSNNGHGEILIKEMGKIVYNEGSWEKGLEVLRESIIEYGIDVDTLVIRDGSGISHSTVIPANEISQLLFAIRCESWFPTMLRSLPIAGEEDRMVGGTLRERMKNLKKVHAKTGTINGVSTLSGYVHTKIGKERIFSIMLNNLIDEEDGPAIEDKIVQMIANEGAF